MSRLLTAVVRRELHWGKEGGSGFLVVCVHVHKLKNSKRLFGCSTCMCASSTLLTSPPSPKACPSSGTVRALPAAPSSPAPDRSLFLLLFLARRLGLRRRSRCSPAAHEAQCQTLGISFGGGGGGGARGSVVVDPFSFKRAPFRGGEMLGRVVMEVHMCHSATGGTTVSRRKIKTDDSQRISRHSRRGPTKF